MSNSMYLKSMAVVVMLCGISLAASAATEANSVGARDAQDLVKNGTDFIDLHG